MYYEIFGLPVWLYLSFVIVMVIGNSFDDAKSDIRSLKARIEKLEKRINNVSN